jgi:hypothetical protein
MCRTLGRPIEDSTDSEEERKKVRKEDERMDRRVRANADKRERKLVRREYINENAARESERNNSNH